MENPAEITPIANETTLTVCVGSLITHETNGNVVATQGIESQPQMQGPVHMMRNILCKACFEQVVFAQRPDGTVAGAQMPRCPFVKAIYENQTSSESEEAA